MRLTRGDVLRDHWYPRAGWTTASRYLTWHLLPERSGALHAVVQAYQSALAGTDGLDLVPVPWLHLTVQGVGFSADVGPDGTRAVVAAARRHLSLLPPVDVTFGPAAVYREGVGLDATPAAPVADLRGALRAAIREARGTSDIDGRDEDTIRPHVSIAYAHADVAADAVLDAVEQVPAAPVRVRFAHASLIELRTQGHLYCWERIADAALAGPR